MNNKKKQCNFERSSWWTLGNEEEISYDFCTKKQLVLEPFILQLNRTTQSHGLNGRTIIARKKPFLWSNRKSALSLSTSNNIVWIPSGIYCALYWREEIYYFQIRWAHKSVTKAHIVMVPWFLRLVLNGSQLLGQKNGCSWLTCFFSNYFNCRSSLGTKKSTRLELCLIGCRITQKILNLIARLFVTLKLIDSKQTSNLRLIFLENYSVN